MTTGIKLTRSKSSRSGSLKLTGSCLNEPYLKCLTTEHGQYVLVELYEGICGNHPGGRTLAHRAHTQGYY